MSVLPAVVEMLFTVTLELSHTVASALPPINASCGVIGMEPVLHSPGVSQLLTLSSTSCFSESCQPSASMTWSSVLSSVRVSPPPTEPKTASWIQSAVSPPFTFVLPENSLLNERAGAPLPPPDADVSEPPMEEKYVVCPSRPSV